MKGNNQKKRELSDDESSDSDSSFIIDSEESILKQNIKKKVNTKKKTNNKKKVKTDKVKADKVQNNIENIVSTTIEKIIDNFKNKNKKTDTEDILEQIESGEFFVDPYVNESLIKSQDTYYLETLQELHNMYINGLPNIKTILDSKMSNGQKQELIQKYYIFITSELLSSEYINAYNYIKRNLKEYSDEIMDMEKRILEYSANPGGKEYKELVLTSKMSFENKVVVYKKLEMMSNYRDTDASEYAKYKNWMDTVLTLPFGIYNENALSLKVIRQTLDENLLYLDNPKDQILNIVAQMKVNPGCNINAIGLCGNKGLGKSDFVSVVAKALNRPMRTISLGGESDASTLSGHNFTYVGSSSGRIVDILRETKCMNPVILIDELDKVSNTAHGKDIIGTLIHLTDTTTNHMYNHDRYLSGITMDLSKVLFIFTYNDPTRVDPILADRLYKINIENYTVKQKLEIAKKHLVRKCQKKFNMEDILFADIAIEYLVGGSSEDEGVRNIKMKIDTILSRINLLKISEEGVIKLKYSKLQEYYKKNKIVLKEHIDTLLDESANSNMKKDEPPMFMYI